ncbi:MAG: hypothetical protein DWQ37_04310 [Planctomycetota bacterium]|nr:MAG: hypothetical protein DWQ37_04310 [Planctomycetota bacterium]
MPLNIQEDHYWLFGQVYSVLAFFAADPQASISRLGGERILVPDDQSNELSEMLRAILHNYSGAADLEVIQAATKIDQMLGERTAHEKLFDPTFWTNRGFIRHPDWATIRQMSREFLLR